MKNIGTIYDFHKILYVGVCFIGLNVYNIIYLSIFSVNGNVCALLFVTFTIRRTNIKHENIFSKTLTVYVRFV